MSWRPRIGQLVRVHYRREARLDTPYHGRIGIVRGVAHGPGPRNVGVELANAGVVVVPRGNLVAEPIRPLSDDRRRSGDR